MKRETFRPTEFVCFAAAGEKLQAPLTMAMREEKESEREKAIINRKGLREEELLLL